MHLSALYIYPVKSLRGCAVGMSEVDALGLAGDRHFMVIDVTGRFLRQNLFLETKSGTLRVGNGVELP